MTAYEDFCSDSQRIDRQLYEVHYKTSAGVAGVLYFSSSQYGTQASASLPSQRFDARVNKPFSYVGAGGQTGEGGIYPMVGLLPGREGGSFSVAQKFGDLDYLRTLNFDNQKVIIRHGGLSKYGALLYDDYRQIFHGVCLGQPLIGVDEVTFKLKNRDELLYTPYQTTRYHGGNWCLYASGGSQQIDFTNNSVYDFTAGEPFTFSFWYFPVTPSLAQFVAVRGASSASGYQIFQDTDDKLHFRTSQAGASQTSDSAALAMERWNHVAITFDGTSVAEIYLNGDKTGMTAVAHTPPLTSTNNLYFFRANSGANRCDCMLKEIRVYKKAQTRDEIRKAMERQLSEIEAANADLVGYWKCDDGDGLTLADSSATGQDGTLSAVSVAWVPSLQGGEELQGAVVPDVWGEKWGMQPRLVHAQHQIYQVHSSFIEEILAVKEGLNPLEEGSPPTPYIYSFLLGDTEDGKYELLNSAQGSYIRLGSAPTLPLSVNLKGDKSDGVYRSNPVDITRLLVCTRGKFPLVDADDIDDAAFDAVAAELVLGDAGGAQVITGWATYDETLLGDLVAQLLGGVGVSAWFKRNGGRFTVKRYLGAKNETAVGIFTRNDVKHMSLEPLDAGSPVYRVSIAWRKNDVIHGAGDVAGKVQGSADHAFGEVDWRIACQPDYPTLEAYPSAGSIALESAITYWKDAITEALRVQGIYNKMPQAFKAMFKHRSLSLERLDVIGFHYQDFDGSTGALQDRFGTREITFLGTRYATQFVVLNIEENPKEGGTVVTFSREDNETDLVFGVLEEA